MKEFNIENIIKGFKDIKETQDDLKFCIIFKSGEIVQLKNSILNGTNFERFKNNIVIAGKTSEDCDKTFKWFSSLFPTIDPEPNKKSKNILEILATNYNHVQIYKLPNVETIEQFNTVLKVNIINQGLDNSFLKPFVPSDLQIIKGQYE